MDGKVGCREGGGEISGLENLFIENYDSLVVKK